MNEIYVSVIVPIYNVSEYIEECLDSLVNQSFEKFEVIMINDGSTDGSELIALKYTEKDERFSLINQNNKGLSAARNIGMDKAVGKYLYFLDGDDFLRKDALEILVDIAEKNDLEIVKFCAYTFNDHSNDYTWEDGGYKYKGSYPDVSDGQSFFLESIKNKDYFPSCCLLFTNRNFVVSHSLKFYEGILNEDNLFHFELLINAKRLLLQNIPLYYRRVRKGSIMQSKNWLLKTKSLLICVKMIDKYTEDNKYIDRKISVWLISHFFHIMLDHWRKMDKPDKFSREAKVYYKYMRTLLKKYRIELSKSECLFFVSMHMYQYYCLVKKHK